MKHRLVLALVGFLVLPRAGYGWHYNGHMVVAEIAYRRLTPQAKAAVDRLVGLDGEPINATFVTSGCWADDLKAYGVHAFDSWHYIDLPFTTDGTALPKEQPVEDVVWAIDQCERTLRSKNAPDVEKARMLRFLVHFVGDIHMPLHCVSRFTKNHPTGDRGGNDFALTGTRFRNLHAYWDSGALLLTPDIERPLTEDGRKKIEQSANEITAAYPMDKLPNSKEADLKKWAQEGLELCKAAVYDGIEEGQSPSDSYQSRAQDTVRKQIALAGYRLADRINRIFE